SRPAFRKELHRLRRHYRPKGHRQSEPLRRQQSLLQWFCEPLCSEWRRRALHSLPDGGSALALVPHPQRDCRIFQNITIPDIIQKVFKNCGFNDFTNSLTATYDPRDYCVQYRETDFNFVSRLMEQYGIF